MQVSVSFSQKTSFELSMVVFPFEVICENFDLCFSDTTNILKHR